MDPRYLIKPLAPVITSIRFPQRAQKVYHVTTVVIEQRRNNINDFCVRKLHLLHILNTVSRNSYHMLFPSKYFSILFAPCTPSESLVLYEASSLFPARARTFVRCSEQSGPRLYFANVMTVSRMRCLRN